MNDLPQVDNLLNIDAKPPVPESFTPLHLDEKKPGPESGSTAIDLKHFSEKQEGGDKQLIEALMQNIKNEPPPAKKIEIEKPQPKISPKKNVNQQQGFFMPFVNGLNGVIDGIWGAFRSLIPMKK